MLFNIHRTSYLVLALSFVTSIFSGCTQLSNLHSLNKNPRQYENVEGYPSDVKFWFAPEIEARELRQPASLFITQPALFEMQGESFVSSHQAAWLASEMSNGLHEQLSAFYDVKNQGMGVQLSVRSELVVFEDYSATLMQRLSVWESMDDQREALMSFEQVDPISVRFQLEFVGSAGQILYAVEARKQLDASADSGKGSLGDIAQYFDFVIDAAIRRLAERTQ